MSQSNADRPDTSIDSLVAKLLDSSFTEAERADFLRWLERDSDACDRLVEHIMLHAALHREIGSHRPPTLTESLFSKTPPATSMPLPVTFANDHPLIGLSRPSSSPGLFTMSVLGWRLFGLLVIIIAASMWWRAGSLPPSSDVAKATGDGGKAEKNHREVVVAEAPQGSPPTTSPYVARIVKTSADCAWGDLDTPGEFLLRCRAGNRMRLAAGIVELEFQSGARIVLQGPAVFTPTGPGAGRLESGRLTGEVADGNFRLVTPAAEVIDLGTAFGVVADVAVGTDVVVFDGHVQVVSRLEGAQPGAVLDMTEGMAARFRFDGTTEYGLKTEAKHFVRGVPSGDSPATRDEICLIDLIAGGDGLGARLAGAIDPSTGQRDYSEKGRKLDIWQRRTNVAFHAVVWHPMINGVIVPTADGRQVQIDSLGGKIDLPPGEGFTWGSLWARGRESALVGGNEIDNDFWGERTLRGIIERLKQVRHGLVGIHANAGITFDLWKMRLVHRRAAIEFHGGVANIENSADWAPGEKPEFKRTVNFHVFVDGKLCFERLAFRRENGETQFAVPLSAADRFLTVVATDDGNIEFDHVVLIDPVIALDEE